MGNQSKKNSLQLFNYLNEFYKTEKTKCLSGIIELNPKPKDLIKAFFLCLELGETNNESSSFPKYSKESLEAVKSLLKEILPILKSENQSTYSIPLVQLAKNIIQIQLDIDLIVNFRDVLLWGGFTMIKKENNKGFLLGLSKDSPKKENLFILNHLKTSVKRNFKRSESYPKLSEEEHFKTNDPFWRTQEGLATVLHSSGVTITNQKTGTTSLEIDDEVLKNMTSDDPKKKALAESKIFQLSQEQNFHYQYRTALSQIYQPNDEINIHKLELQVEQNISVSLYDLFCVVSCLIAKADNLRYIGEFPNSGSIKSIKRDLFAYIHSQKTEFSAIEKEETCNLEIINGFMEIEKHFKEKTFCFISEETLLNWFKKIEELKSTTLLQLKAVLNLLSNIESPIPLNPLYKAGDKYFFNHVSCNYNLNRLIYDNYVTDKLFNPNDKLENEKQLIAQTQKEREILFTNSLADLLEKFTPYVKAQLEYGDPKSIYNFSGLRGEFDVIAYFEKENIIFPIQVKLSNVSPRTEKRKEIWIKEQLKKGVKQVVKDVKLLQTKDGLEFVANRLKVKNGISNPSIYPLIVSDNFFADHRSFNDNEIKNRVFCISYFELKNLILNQKVHENQNQVVISNDKAASQLIEAIEKNYFWDFLDEDANKFQFSKVHQQ